MDKLEDLESSCNDMKDGYDDNKDRLREYSQDVKALHERVDDLESGNSYGKYRDLDLVSESNLLETLEQQIAKKGLFSIKGWEFIEGNNSGDLYIKSKEKKGYYRIKKSSDKVIATFKSIEN